MSDALLADLRRDEGLRLTAYKDTVGVWTVGYGHAFVSPGTTWTRDQAERQLVIDVDKHNAELDKFLPWWRSLNPVRQDVLSNMAFNMGITKLRGFKNTLADIRDGNYDRAATRMMHSLWAKQVGARAQRLARMMRTGVHP